MKPSTSGLGCYSITLRASVGLNGCIGKELEIEMAIRQRCPLVPYLFLIVGEVLNHVF